MLLFGKYILIVIVAVLMLCVLSYISVPVYDFQSGRSFCGDSVYNPYAGADSSCWRKANFHAHQKEKPQCDYTVEQMLEAYRSNGYDIMSISDHQCLNTEHADRPGFIPTYEHGYGINGYHQLVMGAERVTWRDFPLMLTQSQMQYMLHWLRPQAEALVLEPSVVEAFHKLQKLHDEWRETGPVANEYKEALWERFKAASSRINKQHQEHFETLKGEQVKNLELKTGLCVATEELSSQPLTTRKEWNRASDRLLEIQKTWKTIGFAPKKDNNRIYERFRTACDRFFEAKRQFYAGMKTEMEHNLQLKIEICEAAESLMNSEEWKKATDELIALQARWKQIGAVSRRHSDAVWKRFRAACDKFFERKASHFASVDGEHEENLQKKLALLAEMAGADVKAGGYEVIREFQRRWGEIGFVPIKQKDAIQKKYKAAVDELFNTLRGSERDRSMGRFREKVSSFKASGDRRLRSERERLYNKVRQLEQEIGLLENNIGFFAKSKNAEALVADVRAKIERAREEMASTIEKVKLIDKQDQDENNNA